MAEVVVMPALGNTVESCLLTSWSVAVGDVVEVGTVLAEIETDKSNMEVPAGVAGTVLALLASPGDDVPVRAPIAVIGAPGEAVDPALIATPRTEPATTTPIEAPATSELSADTADQMAMTPDPTATSDTPVSGTLVKISAAPAEITDGRTNEPSDELAIEPPAVRSSASPRARGLAESAGIALDQVVGTGPNGRVLARDIAAATAGPGLTVGARDLAADFDSVPEIGTGIGGRVTRADLASSDGPPDDPATSPTDTPTTTSPTDTPTTTSPTDAPTTTSPTDVPSVTDAPETDSEAARPGSAPSTPVPVPDPAVIAPAVSAPVLVPAPTPIVPTEAPLTDVPADAPTVSAPVLVPAPTPSVPSVPPVPSPTKTYPGEITETPLKGVRKIIATRMMDSLANSAQLSYTASAPAGRLLALQERFTNSDPELGFAKITIGDLVGLAAVRTLAAHPKLNAHLVDETIRTFAEVHLGIAVDTPRGLLVPTLRHAGGLQLRDFSRQTKDLAAAAVAGSISPDLLTGATFTVSNLGAFGVESFTPLLNLPQVAILGVGTIVPRAVLNPDGSVGVEHRIGLSLTADHRAIDGADAARFLKDLCAAIADVDLLVLGDSA